MKRKNLSYKEVVKYIANRVENAYNLNACFNEEYINHIQNIGSDIPFRFEFRGKVFNILEEVRIIEEDGTERGISSFSIEEV